MASASEVLSESTLTSFSQNVYRNIVSLIVSEDLFDDLTDDPQDYAVAQAIESLHTPPYYYSKTPIVDRPFEASHWFSAIQFPFENWQESRFSQGKFGVWYGASDVKTTVYETVYHWLKRTRIEEGQLPDGRELQRKVYTVHVDALILDLRSLTKVHPALLALKDYTLTQQMGQVIHKQGHPGLLTRSARCKGDVQAIFNAAVLSDARINCWLRYQIQQDTVLVLGAGDKEVTSIPVAEFESGF